MKNITKLTCKVIAVESGNESDLVGAPFTLINPFAKHGKSGYNNPEGIMLLHWTEGGARYVYRHIGISKDYDNHYQSLMEPDESEKVKEAIDETKATLTKLEKLYRELKK